MNDEKKVVKVYPIDSILEKATALIKECEESDRPIAIGILYNKDSEPETESVLLGSVRCDTENGIKIIRALTDINHANAKYWKDEKEKHAESGLQ